MSFWIVELLLLKHVSETYLEIYLLLVPSFWCMMLVSLECIELHRLLGFSPFEKEQESVNKFLFLLRTLWIHYLHCIFWNRKSARMFFAMPTSEFVLSRPLLSTNDGVGMCLIAFLFWNGWCVISSIHACWGHIRRDAMSNTTGDKLVLHFSSEMLIVWGTENFVEVPINRKVTHGTLLRFWINSVQPAYHLLVPVHTHLKMPNT